MSNRILSPSDEQDICHAMQGLSGAPAARTAHELAEFYGIHFDRVYVISKPVRPARKTRSTKGQRKADLFASDGLRLIVELAVNHNLDTESAIELARANGLAVPVSRGTIDRYKREAGIGSRQLCTLRRTHHSFEAEFPLQIFQFDISGVKERWMDLKTRRILRVPESEVNKNHSNKRSDRVPVWKMNGLDDNSRLLIYQYLAVLKPNSTHYINYLRYIVTRIGLPWMIYTDNDSILTSKRIQRGADILDKMFAAGGGFKLVQHAPGNPQATGKIERGHQIVEQFERKIGIKIEYGDVPTIDGLNRFAVNSAIKYNRRVHRTTGEQPRLRFRQTDLAKRVITVEQFDAAFLSQELDLPLNADVTVTINKVKYQLPRDDKYPFTSLAALKGIRLTVIFIENADFLVVIVPNGDEFPIPRVEARIVIGRNTEVLPESASAQNQKLLKASAIERKEKLKSEGKKLIVPDYDTDVEDDEIVMFPQREQTGDDAILDELTHHIRQIASDGRRLDYYAALDNLQEREIFAKPPARDDAAWLRSLFVAAEIITEADLQTALDNRSNQSQPAPVRHLRLA